MFDDFDCDNSFPTTADFRFWKGAASGCWQQNFGSQTVGFWRSFAATLSSCCMWYTAAEAPKSHPCIVLLPRDLPIRKDSSCRVLIYSCMHGRCRSEVLPLHACSDASLTLPSKYWKLCRKVFQASTSIPTPKRRWRRKGKVGGGWSEWRWREEIGKGRDWVKDWLLGLLIYMGQFRWSGSVWVGSQPNFNCSPNLSHYPNRKPNRINFLIWISWLFRFKPKYVHA